MKRLLFLGIGVVMAVALQRAACGDEDVARRTFRIDLSTRETMKTQDWSGKATVSKGRIVKVVKTSGASDTIHPDKSWTIVYGRSLQGQPKVQPRAKALIVTVESSHDAVLTLATKAGDIAFRVDEIPEKKKIEGLDGNVLISLTTEPKGKKPRKGRPQLAAAKIAGELPSVPVTDGTRQSDWPALTVTSDGTTWAAFVEWDGEASDRVALSRRPPGGVWQKPIGLDDGAWDHYWPAVAPVGDAVLVVWSSQVDGNAELYWAVAGPEGVTSAPKRLTSSAYSDFHARLVADGKGGVVLVWQSLRSGASDVFARRYADGEWSDAVRVSASPANDWQPCVAVDGFGRAWISWDSYHHGNYDVFLRSYDGGELGPVVQVTSESTAQFHSSVAVDRLNRVWVAWDDGGENWGKDLSTSSAAPGNAGLHASRAIAVRVVVDGTLHDVAPQPGAAMTGAMTRFAELPQLATDGNGTLWLVFRHWTIRRPTEMYHTYVMKLTDAGWTTPWRLAASSGRNTQWAGIARGAAGQVYVTFSSDSRAPDNLPEGQVTSLIYRAAIAELEPGAGLPEELTLTPTDLPAPTTAWTRRPRTTMQVDGQTYTLVMGDCHRHTDIRGHSAVDASIMDTFRYALDPGQLDYMGLGDHNEVFGGKWPDGLRDYQWWWTQKAVDLFSCPPTFVGLYSYEHSMSSPGGHRNIIFLKRGAPLRMIDRGAKVKPNPGNMPPELWKWVREEVLTQPGQRCVIVPHTFAAGPLASWDWPNAEFDCLLEMYQGCRGSYEKWGLPPGEKRGGTQTKKPGHFAQDALAKGNVYGFVSFSDHRSTHNSWGCVWAEDVTREAIIDGMLNRRTYAATDEIVLKVAADGKHTMGQAFEASAAKPPSWRIEVDAPDTILRVDVVKNGEFIWTKNPNATTFRAVFQDVDVTPGKAYYYVRVFQRDPEKPDGDPEIAWSSPMFVTYK